MDISCEQWGVSQEPNSWCPYMFPLAARRLPSRRAAHACACACARTRLPPSPPIAQAARRRSLTAAAARPRPARCPLTVIRMPSLSPSMVSATVTHWNVDLGAPITCGELIVEVETDTLDEFKLGNVVGMEIEAWDEGYLARGTLRVARHTPLRLNTSSVRQHAPAQC